jgi:hypothetical protein
MGEISLKSETFQLGRREPAKKSVDLLRAATHPKAPQRTAVSVSIASLLPADSPRLEGQDAEHVGRLMEIDEPLPPILVERRSMRVIDGMHRLTVALLRGDESILVEFFDGTAEEAFLRAVEANVTHGLPLSKEDRRAATERIISSRPEMSDRAIARATGLGAKTVAAVRRSVFDAAPQLSARIGRDGKLRPLNSAEGRERAAALIAEYPDASLRELARLAGISPATVSDVRKRIMSGEPPVPEPKPDESATKHEPQETPEPGQAGERRAARKARLVPPDPVPLLEKLLRDPSLRHKEEGRRLLRVLQQNALREQDWSKLADAVPSHCGDLVVDLARQYAETWTEFAKELDERT